MLSLANLDQIFRDNYQWVYRTAYGVSGRREDAEDVLQNLFLRLLQRGFPPDVRENARGYLYRAAINLALDSVRSRRRQILRETLASMQSAASTVNSGSNEEIEASLLKVVGELDPENVELLRLRYMDNHSDAQIARMRGTSRGAIAVRLCRIRTRIRKLMRTHDETLRLACDELLEHPLVDKTKVQVTSYAQENRERHRVYLQLS